MGRAVTRQASSWQPQGLNPGVMREWKSQGDRLQLNIRNNPSFMMQWAAHEVVSSPSLEVVKERLQPLLRITVDGIKPVDENLN